MKRKYFEEEKINKVLLCQRCEQNYIVPLMLPCGKSICKQCFENKFGEDYETTIKPNSLFKCLMCKKEHTMPTEGLPINEQISMLIEMEAKEIYQIESGAKLKQCLEILDEKNTILKKAIDNREQVIRDHYESIRQEIYLSFQSRMDELNKACDELVQKTNTNEIENLKFLESVGNKNEDMIKELNEMSKRFEKLRDKSEKHLRPKACPSENELSESLEKAENLNIEVSDSFAMFKNSLFLNGNKLTFTKSELAFDENSIGSLKSVRVKTNLVNIDTIKLESEDDSSDPSVCTFTILSDGTLASASADKKIRLWNTSTSECIRTLNGHEESLSALADLSNGILVSGSEDGTIKIWNTSTGEWIRTISAHTHTIWSLLVLPDGTLVSGSEDGAIKIWNTSTGECIRLLNETDSKVWSMALLPDGTIVSGLNDGSIKLWNPLTDECINTLTGHTGGITVMTVLSDGTLASGSHDTTIKLWNTTTGECISTLTDHKDIVWSLAVLANDVLVSGSNDNTIKIWNSFGECMCSHNGHTSPVIALAVLPNGTTLVSGSDDKTIKMWNTSNDEFVSLIF